MKKITGWIKRHQVIAFFATTFGITWGLGFSYDAVMNKGIFLLAPLAFVATAATRRAISSVVHSRISPPGLKSAFHPALSIYLK